ncbi:MAG: DUF2249 domain-containing protein [Burkholderiaceae bacterium]
MLQAVMQEDPACTSLPPPAGGMDDAARRWSEPEAEHIDVRGLAPPQPLVAIVRLIESLPPTRVVIVHHDRDPVLLYPELAERGWQAEPVDAPEGEVRLRLVADGAN